MTLDIHITHRRGGFALDVALTCPPGVTVVFGPSGSGKTTLLQCVAGIIRPASGHIRLGDREWFGAKTQAPVHKRKIGYVFQDGRLFPHLTVRQNIHYAQRFGPGQPPETIEHWCTVLGVSVLLDRMPATLSGGERQRVALARALARTPDVLCLDEPLSALDAPRRRDVLDDLERVIADAKIPVLYVTHDIQELTRLAHRVALIDDGNIVLSGPAADVLTDPVARPYLPGRNLGALVTCKVGPTAQGVTDLQFNGGTIRLANVAAQEGGELRLRVAAQDVILSREKPAGLSALNVFQATVTDIRPDQASVVVSIAVGDTTLLSRITRVSAQTMELQIGATVHAIIKATATDAMA